MSSIKKNYAITPEEGCTFDGINIIKIYSTQKAVFIINFHQDEIKPGGEGGLIKFNIQFADDFKNQHNIGCDLIVNGILLDLRCPFLNSNEEIIAVVPKPMAPINGKPFLEILLKSLEKKGIRRVILSVGYKAKVIMDYFGNSCGDIELVYEVEETPLGTGGAIKAALTKCNTEKVLVVNGDTYIDFDAKILTNAQVLNNNDSIIFGVEIDNKARYGSIESDENFVVTGFVEKGCTGSGFINSRY